jgi:DNA topoisomerase III
MSVVVIAEKPSVARDLARVLGAYRKAQGYLEGNGYRVTWALGHLVHLAEPDDYGPPWKGRWTAAQLPMIPAPWRLKLAPKTTDQFQLVKRLITDPATERLVCATDAGREGELIFRLIYEQARCAKPFDRLWVSSLTDEAIRAGFRALKPGDAYDDLARAARARAQADWLIGMNLTRAYTVRNGVLCTIGRVQTPTLAMIVARDQEIAAFKATPFYELVAHLHEGFRALYCKDGETRILDKREAERLHALLAPHRTGTVRELDRQVRREPPPPLYDLTSLQRDANRRLGLTAAQVLELAQTLYETHKLISYPRTESRHIGEDLVPELPRILKGLDHPQAPAALERLASGHRLGRTYVDQTKLTDHHAILPTGRPVPAGLRGPLRGVYDLIQTRFVCCFLPDQVVEETRVHLDIGGCDFLARGSRELDPGWRVADPPPRRERPGTRQTSAEAGGEGADEAPPSVDDQALPPLESGQTVHVDRLELREGETSPPRPYTDATLLASMKNAGRTLDDKDLARAMRATGLGTPATRAEIIERLIRTGYVERQRKQLRSTDKGRALIAVVAQPLKEPALTAHWEQRLKEVEEGTRPVEEFDRGIRDLVQDLIPRVWGGPAFTPAQAAAAREGSGARRSGRSAQQARRTRQPTKVRGARRTGGTSSGGEVGVVAGPVGLPCPKCHRGLIIQGRRGFGCDRYREGCDFVVWREVSGKGLTERQVAELIRTGRTRLIQGFRDPSGQTFAARLELGPEGQTVIRRADPSKPDVQGDAG